MIDSMLNIEKKIEFNQRFINIPSNILEKSLQNKEH